MIDRTARINALACLGDYLEEGSSELQDAIELAFQHNPWFTPGEVQRALQSIRSSFLRPHLLMAWTDRYGIPPFQSKMHRVGLVMAGNIPLVGFHDFLCVLASGHHAGIKMSDKDRFLLPVLLDKLTEYQPGIADHWSLLDRFENLDAVIATGSNNSARYFEAYFGKYPHIIRRNRNAAAILSGRESIEELRLLCTDILAYFGLGCRNVSKLYVPEEYDFTALMEVTAQVPGIRDHHRFRNNYDYQYALALLNQEPHRTNDVLLFRENPGLISPMASIHYEYYSGTNQLIGLLERERDSLQCVVSGTIIPGWEVVPFGQSQHPGLFDYADGVDVMDFLSKLNEHA